VRALQGALDLRVAIGRSASRDVTRGAAVLGIRRRFGGTHWREAGPRVQWPPMKRPISRTSSARTLPFSSLVVARGGVDPVGGDTQPPAADYVGDNQPGGWKGQN
jgi:hypothetical protein